MNCFCVLPDEGDNDFYAPAAGPKGGWKRSGSSDPLSEDYASSDTDENELLVSTFTSTSDEAFPRRDGRWGRKGEVSVPGQVSLTEGSGSGSGVYARQRCLHLKESSATSALCSVIGPLPLGADSSNSDVYEPSASAVSAEDTTSGSDDHELSPTTSTATSEECRPKGVGLRSNFTSSSNSTSTYENLRREHPTSSSFSAPDTSATDSKRRHPTRNKSGVKFELHAPEVLPVCYEVQNSRQVPGGESVTSNTTLSVLAEDGEGVNGSVEQASPADRQQTPTTGQLYKLNDKLDVRQL